MDILKAQPYLFLASRMKRLSERMMADAVEIIREEGFEGLQSSHMSIFAALDQENGLCVSDLVDQIGFSQPAITRTLTGIAKLGHVQMKRCEEDQRQKRVYLTDQGKTLVAQLRASPWLRIEQAAQSLCAETPGDLMAELDALEEALAAKALKNRAPKSHLSIIPWDDSLAGDFYRITEEWVSSMFTMEENDYAIIERPRELIIDNDGEIWFIEDADLGVIGTCALMKIEDGVYELTKMGVTPAARGKKAGEKLLDFVLGRAHQMGMKKLFLLTNKKCEAAIHLYEKLGFEHDAKMLEKYAARYCRCNVAMTFPLSSAETESQKEAAHA